MPTAESLCGGEGRLRGIPKADVAVIADDKVTGTDWPRLITMYPDCAGDVGTVVERHGVPGLEDGYSVEFFDMTGRTVVVVTVSESELRAPTEADRPSVRVLAHST